MNQVCLTGRLTKDPELLYGKETNKAWSKFTLAVEGFKREDADFFDCKAFGKTAETICKYLTKGRKMLVIGRLAREKKTDKEGKVKMETFVFVNEFEFADKAADYGNVKANTEVKAARQDAIDKWMEIPSNADEGLPFN